MRLVIILGIVLLVSGCVSTVRYPEMSQSLITQHLLKPGLFEQQDISVDVQEYDTVYSWSHNGHDYVYSIGVPRGLGNVRGNDWRLRVEPYTLEGISADMYPFLSCEDFEASREGQWEFSVKKDGDVLVIYDDNMMMGGGEKLDKEGLEKLTRNFTTCDGEYDYTYLEFLEE